MREEENSSRGVTTPALLIALISIFSWASSPPFLRRSTLYSGGGGRGG